MISLIIFNDNTSKNTEIIIFQNKKINVLFLIFQSTPNF